MFRASVVDDFGTTTAAADDHVAPTQPATQPLNSQLSQHTGDDVLARLVSMDSDVVSFNLDVDKTMTIGRKSSCAVVLHDPTVSSVHCKIFYDDSVPMGSVKAEAVVAHAQQQQAAQGWSKSTNMEGEVFYGASNFWIEDMSSNGTFVNMVKLGKGTKARLCHNDVISLCRPEQKRKTKGTKLTWLFQLTTPHRMILDQYPAEVRNKYDVKELLGTGAFSEVKVAVERATGELCAIKILDKLKYTGGTRSGESLAREVDILKRLSHPNIIKILDVIDSERYLFIVLELARGGELFDRIAKKTRHSEDEARLIFSQLLHALQYLHSHNICHRDLKPENILLQEKDGLVVKLTDFGFSRVVGEAEMMKTLCIPDDHEVLTNAGWMDLDTWEAHRDDPCLLMAGFNPNDGTIVYERPMRQVIFPRDKRSLVRFRGRADVDYMVTKEHNVYVQMNGLSSPAKVRAAVLLESPFCVAKHVSVAENGVVVVSNTPELMHIAKLFNDVPLEAFCVLFGLWCSRGSLEGSILRFCNVSPSEAETFREVFRLCHVASHQCSYLAQNSSFYVSSMRWSSVFQSVPTHARFPLWVWSLGARQCARVILGLGPQVCTSSLSFRDDLIRLALHAGMSASFRCFGNRFYVGFSSRLDETATPLSCHEEGDIAECESSQRLWCVTMPCGFFWVRSVVKNSNGDVVQASRPVVTGNCGTPMYLAPEVMALSMGTRDPSFESAHGYGKAVDMWSLGVILYILLSGRPPFDDRDFSRLCETVLKGSIAFPVERWDGVSDSAKDLVRKLLVVAPRNRLNVDEALQHRWITGEKDETGVDELGVERSPPRFPTKPNMNERFVAPSAKKKVATPSDKNPVMKLLQQYETKSDSPDLGFGSKSSASSPSLSVQQETPLLIDSPILSSSSRKRESSPTVRRLGFETPEKPPRKSQKAE